MTRGYALLLRKELLELLRTLRLPVVLIVFVVLGLVSPVVARYMREILEAVGGAEFQGLLPEPDGGDAVAQLTRNVGQFGVLTAILVTMGSVATEKERGTAAFLLTKPLSRGAFLAAKVTAIGVLLALATASAGVLCWVYTAILFEPLPVPAFAGAVALIWLSLATFAAITFSASVMAPSALVAGGIGVASLMVAGVLSVLPGLSSWLPTGLWGLADTLGIGTVPDPLVGPVLFNLAIIAAALALAGWSFRRQQL